MITNNVPLNVSDKAATPVVHVFTPSGRISADNVVNWLDMWHNNGLPIGFESIDYSVKQPKAAGSPWRVKVTMARPIVDFTIATAPKLQGTMRFSGEFIFPEAASLQNRKDLVEMVKNLFAQDQASLLGDNIAQMTLPY
ncbi:MAG: hypothetical protein [Sanya fiers-like virus 9]|nr:MAG: hypothetical protein [Sanya fiers-like virus 9]UUW21235.1 MAG: hypothetical protein [Sanya fiers-like virus 9]